MTLRVFNLSRVAPLLMLAAGLGASSPAAACGYSFGCYAPSPVIVQPYYQSCSSRTMRQIFCSTRNPSGSKA